MEKDIGTGMIRRWVGVAHSRLVLLRMQHGVGDFTSLMLNVQELPRSQPCCNAKKFFGTKAS